MARTKGRGGSKKGPLFRHDRTSYIYRKKKIGELREEGERMRRMEIKERQKGRMKRLLTAKKSRDVPTRSREL